jgi:hypothetical protein
MWRTRAWRRSSFCGNDNCIEVMLTGTGVAVRDSKDPSGPVLRFDLAEWAAFVAGARAGDFDPPASRT